MYEVLRCCSSISEFKHKPKIFIWSKFELQIMQIGHTHTHTLAFFAISRRISSQVAYFINKMYVLYINSLIAEATWGYCKCHAQGMSFEEYMETK